MDKTKKLIIPEINADELNIEDKIIANPNCSTIQMLIAIAPIHKNYGITEDVFSTFIHIISQSIRSLYHSKNYIL